MAFEYAIVLTGGIATGKSSVAKLFQEYGFSIIDADKIAHSMLDFHHKKIADLFGNEYVKNGEVLRKKLGALIFGDSVAKVKLENLLHPLIFNEIERQASSLDVEKAPYLVDIPLFFETNRYPIKESIVVYVPQPLQLKRLMQRDETTQEEALKRMNAQIPIEEKKQQATYLIDNQGDLNDLQLLCGKVKDKIIKNHKER